jgi:hypothetical protein
LTHVLSATGNLLGALVALAVAAIGYLSDVGLPVLATRAIVSGLVCALLFRLLGFAAVSVLRSRFDEGTDRTRRHAARESASEG